MFDHHTYEKGGLVLNLLQEMVGKAVFDEILRTFLAKYGPGNVTTSDFTEHVSNITGEDYGWFFEQWVLSPGHPVLDVSYTWDEQSEMLVMTVRQTQDTSTGVPVFDLPFKVGITTRSGKKVESARITEVSHTFRFNVAERPLMVRFDEGDVLLKEWTLEKPVLELLYQLGHDNVTGRIWAAGALQDHLDDARVPLALTTSAIHDGSWAVRQKAIQVLATRQDQATTDLLKARVMHDGDRRVRVTALESLGALRDPELEAFFLEAAEIPSPRNAVRKAAQSALDAAVPE